MNANPQPNAHPPGTIATVEGRIAVVIGTPGHMRWQWLNGDWTTIVLGGIYVLGSTQDMPFSTASTTDGERP